MLLNTQMHLPAGPLSLVLRQVVSLDVRPTLHHDVLCLGTLQKLQRRVLAKSLHVSLLITHLVQVINRNHLEDLHITRVLETCVRAACVDKLATALMVPLKVVLKLELIILLLVVTEVRFIGRPDCGATARANQHLDVQMIRRRLVANMNAQLTVRQSAVHVVNLPVALERVNETFGVFTHEGSCLGLIF